MLLSLRQELETSKLGYLPVPISQPTSSSEVDLLHLSTVLPIIPPSMANQFTSNTIAHAVEDVQSNPQQQLADTNTIDGSDVSKPILDAVQAANSGQPLEPQHCPPVVETIEKLAQIAKLDSLNIQNEDRLQRAYKGVAARSDAQSRTK
jgi:hypothetical protein